MLVARFSWADRAPLQMDRRQRPGLVGSGFLSRSTPPFSKRMKSSRSPKTSDLTAFSGEQRQKRPRPVSGDGSRASVLPFPYPRVYRKGGRKGIQNPMATIVKRGIATNGARALLGALLALRLGTRSY